MSDDLMALLTGRRGHFRMESGFHCEVWYDLDRLLADRTQLQPFVAELAARLATHRLEVVCGPETGGAQLAAMIADELGIEFARTERFAPPASAGFFPVRYVVPPDQREKLAGRRVAIVDDAISAGSAVRGTLTDLRACDAEVVALGALFVFGHHAQRFADEQRLTIHQIASADFRVWHPSECPLCLSKMPLEPFP